MPTYLTYASTQATTRVWNATTGGVPTDWELPEFDDSGWPLSSAPSRGGGPTYLPDGVEAVAPWAVAAAATDTMLYRSHFTHPGTAYQPYLFEYFGSIGGEGEIFLNGNGMLGIGKISVLSIYAPVAGDNVVAAMAVGGTIFTWPFPLGGGFEAWLGWRLTFSIPDSGGQPYAWGTVTPAVNDKGFLGTGDTVTHLTPTLVDTTVMPATVVKIVSNGLTTLYLTVDGAVYGSGDNSTGLLAGAATDSAVHATPSLLAVGHNWPFADVSIGSDCAMVIERNGDVRMWGPNAHGSLGRGDATPEYSGDLVQQLGTRILIGTDQDKFISAGRSFAIIRDRDGFCLSAGDNTYGQLGQGTSGGDVLSWDFVNQTNVNSATPPLLISAGDDQTVFLLSLPLFSTARMYGCGRAEYGSLGHNLYVAGTGLHKIVSTPMDIGFGDETTTQIAQAGPMTFWTGEGPPPRVRALGDGVPFGGAGDLDGTIVYGTSSNTVAAPQQHFTGSATFDFDLQANKIATVSGGSHNPYAPGDSKVAHGAIAYYSSTWSGSFHVEDHPRLYTWGWGGAGQMGSGTDPTTNLQPVWLNGLVDVIAATACASGMFVIGPAIAQVRRGRGYAQVIG